MTKKHFIELADYIRTSRLCNRSSCRDMSLRSGGAVMVKPDDDLGVMYAAPLEVAVSR